MLVSSLAYAQQDVYLNINHALGNLHFSFGQMASNDMNHDFKVTRLQYYISEIKLTYDGGQDTLINDLWVLVDAANTTNVLLGNFTFTTLESVSFGVGVNQAVNHADPSSYSPSHPLAPKSPSMHWGWTAGYRFVALEGFSGSNLTDVFQIHALDDQNYFQQTITTAGSVQGQDLIVDLDANYEMALKGINVNSAPVNHGSSGEAAAVLVNFKNDVFSEASGNISLTESSLNQITIYPTVLSTGERINIEDSEHKIETMIISDMSGRRAFSVENIDGQSSIIDLKPGIYLISFYAKGQLLSAKKISIL